MPRLSLITLIFSAAALLLSVGMPTQVVAQATLADDSSDGKAVGGLTELREPPTLARITKLVSQLSDDDYRVREPASTSLVRIGIAARPVLIEAIESADVEIRHRASRILSIIVEEDFEARIRAFVADVDGKNNATLPGWQRFAERISDDKLARAMFVEMHRSEPELLGAYRPPGGDLSEISNTFNNRCVAIDKMFESDMIGWQPEISLGTISTLLLIGSDPEVPTGGKIDALLTKLIKWDAVASGMNAKPTRSVMRELLDDWVAKSTLGSDARITQENLRLAMRYDLPAGLAPAVQIVRQSALNNESADIGLRTIAVMTIGRLGGSANLVDLEPLLEDESLVRRPQAMNRGLKPVDDAAKRENGYVQMRDVALAVMVHLSGQKLTDYGYRYPKKVDESLFDPSSLLFETLQDRATALAKWKRWSAGPQAGQDKAARRQADQKGTEG